jgi:hypothetical protein
VGLLAGSALTRGATPSSRACDGYEEHAGAVECCKKWPFNDDCIKASTWSCTVAMAEGLCGCLPSQKPFCQGGENPQFIDDCSCSSDVCRSGDDGSDICGDGDGY